MRPTFFRRDFLRKAVAGILALIPVRLKGLVHAIGQYPPIYFPLTPSQPFLSQRTPPFNRNFISDSVERMIESTKATIHHPKLAWMFENAFPYALDTSVRYQHLDGKPDTFVVSRDMATLTLPDSTALLWPYLPLVNFDDPLKCLFQGLIRRQSACILIDPYARVYHLESTDADKNHSSRLNPSAGRQPIPVNWKAASSEQVRENWKAASSEGRPLNPGMDGSERRPLNPGMDGSERLPLPGVQERKWQLDSLCFPLRLAYQYWKTTGDTTPFTRDWDLSVRLIVDLFSLHQRGAESSSRPLLPSFPTQRAGHKIHQPPFAVPGRYKEGLPSRGMIYSTCKTGQHPVLSYLIPSNLFAKKCLENLAEMAVRVLADPPFARRCQDMASEIALAVQQFGTYDHPHCGKLYAYEVDGYGHQLVMDDAGIPGLISLSYLDPEYLQDPVYTRTCEVVWSIKNPYFFSGSMGEGMGIPQAGLDYISTMSLITKALTSTLDHEILTCLRTLIASVDDTGFIPESFHKDDYNRFNGPRCPRISSYFGEMIVKLAAERPHILQSV